MCGFVSIHSSRGPLDEHVDALDAMLATIAHRGPDGTGRRIVPGQLVQGHVRLAVIDPDGGHQPMRTPDGRYSVVFNGAIYNYIELRESLERRGVRFSTTSDTEVLLHLMAIDGAEAISSLIGMFSFVFHDRDTNSWIAARDAFGIKPLYLVRTNDALMLASEVKALLAHGQVQARLDLRALAQYVVFQFTLGRRRTSKGEGQMFCMHVAIGLRTRPSTSMTTTWSRASSGRPSTTASGCNCAPMSPSADISPAGWTRVRSARWLPTTAINACRSFTAASPRAPPMTSPPTLERSPRRSTLTCTS